jgi:hypothetical protein
MIGALCTSIPDPFSGGWGLRPGHGLLLEWLRPRAGLSQQGGLPFYVLHLTVIVMICYYLG